jgi:hypothetical protein
MGALLSKRPTVVPEIIERQRSFSIYPTDWAGKPYSEVVAFLRTKYPNAHITTQAEKESTCDLTFDRPVSFDDTHIIVVYNCHNNSVMGFYEAST